MKIMYLLFSFTMGGTEKLVIDICNQMIKRGHKIYLYVVNDLYEQEMFERLDKNVIVHLQNRRVGGGQVLHTMKLVSDFIQENSIDVVHCNSLNSPELLMYHKLLHHKTKVIYTIHGVDQYRKIKKWGRVYRNIVCDRFIAISKSVHDDIIKSGASAKKTVIVYNAIEVDKFSIDTDRVFNKDKIVIGNVARIMPSEKGQDVLLRALIKIKEKYPNIVCRFAGGVAQNQKEEYNKLLKFVEEERLTENVEFVGTIQDVPAFMSQIDLFVLPSRFEGFGLSLVEAMAMGVPCVASNLNGPREIIDLMKCGTVFESENSNDLSEKIIDIIENYSIVKCMANEKRKEVAERFEIKNMCNQLENEYQM